MEPFHFKKFTIDQDRCAMKIGTDAVLLGAWASLRDKPSSILDIGTGTGIIALILAQKSDAEIIDALEIDEDAFEQAVENFESSDWGDRLFCYHASFDEFVEEMQDEDKYDLIVSNPPFYSDDFSSGDAKRDQARFAKALPFEKLLEGAALLLSKMGTFNVVIPKKKEKEFLQLARHFDFFAQRITYVKGNPNTPVKRVLLELAFSEAQVIPEELVIEKSRHDYTPEYIELVKDFYIKM